jgi:hypothetical protein
MASRNNANELSLRGVALALGMDRPTIAKRLDEIRAIPEGAGKIKVYRLRDVIRALAADCGASCEDISYADQLAIARTEQTKVATQAAEIKLQERAGQLISVGDAVEMVHRVVQPIDRFLLTFADQLEFECGLSGAVIERVTKLIRTQRELLLEEVSA